MSTQRRTKYQMTHPPVRRLEIQCTERERKNGFCVACGRDVKTARTHKPNVHGALGWVEYYADGSTRITPPGLT